MTVTQLNLDDKFPCYLYYYFVCFCGDTKSTHSRQQRSVENVIIFDRHQGEVRSSQLKFEFKTNLDKAVKVLPRSSPFYYWFDPSFPMFEVKRNLNELHCPWSSLGPRSLIKTRRLYNKFSSSCTLGVRIRKNTLMSRWKALVSVVVSYARVNLNISATIAFPVVSI